jgi:hypothetical protein
MLRTVYSRSCISQIRNRIFVALVNWAEVVPDSCDLPHRAESPQQPARSSVPPQPLRFKQAETEREFEQIHGLLYRTFVVEIPRYADPGTGYLVDKYHERNRYFIALRGDRVCGVVAVHGTPPFSVAETLDDPDVLLCLCPRLLEARILAVEPGERFGIAFAGLARSVYKDARRRGFRYVAITGLAARQEMYRRIGFRPMGLPRLRGREHFVPMLLDLEDVAERARKYTERRL